VYIKAVLEWDIDLPGMKAIYRGSAQAREQNPLVGITMTFYMAADGEGRKNLCGGLGTIPAEAQTALDAMTTRRQKQFLRRLIEEGDRVFRTAWKQSVISASKLVCSHQLEHTNLYKSYYS
jgi:hypothetical protein